MITRTKETIKAGIPPAFRERCAIRCVDSKFGPNKKDNPMITSEWELIGYFGQDGQLQTEIKRGDLTYKVAGLRNMYKYWTLTNKAAKYYLEFESLAKGEEVLDVDETNPDISYLDGLVMQAIVTGKNEIQRKLITDEEKTALASEGKPPVGEPILDDEGNPMEFAKLEIGQIIKPYKGELPPY